MAKPGTAPQLEVNRDDDFRHGHSTVVSFGQRDRRVIKWDSKNGESWPVTFSVAQKLESTMGPPGGVLPTFAALGQNAAADMRLRVSWGSGGIQSQALMDLDRSTCFCLVAASVTVDVIYLGMGDIAPAALPNVRVSADASEGTPGVLPPPRLTERVSLAIAPGPPGINIAVPAFAFDVRPAVPYASPLQQVMLQELGATGDDLWRATFGVDSPDRRMLIENACRVVNLQHNGPAVLPRASLVFRLALG